MRVRTRSDVAISVGLHSLTSNAFFFLATTQEPLGSQSCTHSKNTSIPTMSLNQNKSVFATSPVQPSLLQQVGMAGGAAVITVTFIHPIDVVKVSFSLCSGRWNWMTLDSFCFEQVSLVLGVIRFSKVSFCYIVKCVHKFGSQINNLRMKYKRDSPDKFSFHS